jgi:hypothetical protein
MNNSTNPSHRPLKSLLAAWLVIRNFVRWFGDLVVPTEQDFREAAVDLGNTRA